jgi:hypothetical protein
MSTFMMVVLMASLTALSSGKAFGQLTDKTQTLTPNAGINKSFADESNAGSSNDGRGDISTPRSSLFIIGRDPFRAIRRGRHPAQACLGAGLVDSCAGCHARPRGSAGVGGDVATRPDSRDTPHLFGLGLREMRADEMTSDLRSIPASAATMATSSGAPVTRAPKSKGVSFGSITANPNGTLDNSGVEGVDSDLRVRPFFAQGSSFSMSEFLVGAFKDEMALETVDPDLLAAHNGGHVVTPSGLVLDGTLDTIKAPLTDNSRQGCLFSGFWNLASNNVGHCNIERAGDTNSSLHHNSW